MKPTRTTLTVLPEALTSRVRDVGVLVKFKLNLTVVFSAVMAYLITATDASIESVGLLALAGFCVAGAANALNQILERDFDRLMERTADRPLAAGRMGVGTASIIAGLLSISGILMLASFNPWTVILGAVAMLSYAFLYTPMKRISPAAIAIGAFPGALPVLIGSLAWNGEVTPLAMALFAIQFFWQFPHFSAIGWLGFEDYQKAGFRFIASHNGRPDSTLGLQSMLYGLCLVPVGLVPYINGYTGLGSAIVVVVASAIYAWFGWNLQVRNDRKAALWLMFSSFFYLPVVLCALWLDKVPV